MCIKEFYVGCVCFINCDIFVRLINLYATAVLLQVNSILFLVVLCMDQKYIIRLYFQITMDLNL